MLFNNTPTEMHISVGVFCIILIIRYRIKMYIPATERDYDDEYRKQKLRNGYRKTCFFA